MRKNDSFDTFEEVLQIAMAQNVDLLLLGGDLFHDNKPSRTTIVKAVKLLTDYCMHDRPVTFEVLSDQRDSFASGYGLPPAEGRRVEVMVCQKVHAALLMQLLCYVCHHCLLARAQAMIQQGALCAPRTSGWLMSNCLQCRCSVSHACVGQQQGPHERQFPAPLSHMHTQTWGIAGW